MRIINLLTSISLMLSSTILFAYEYNLVVQPVLSEQDIRKNYQPLAEYLASQTGHTFTIKTHKNFFTYWERMKKAKGFDFVLDAAHFTDFRVQRQNYTVLAKFPDTVSFTVVSNEDNLVFDMEELISKKIATMASPGLGAIRLNSMFPNPARLPYFIQIPNSNEAAVKVLNAEVDAAIIPTPMVSLYSDLNTILSTEPVPHMALSAASHIPADVIKQVKQALLGAKDMPAGKKMLSRLNIASFEPATNSLYHGYAELLDGVFGY